MEASTIGSSTFIPTQRATTRGFDDLKGEDFFALMIAQLQAQDPMKPTDNQQLLNQMSSIRQMEQSENLTATLSALASEQRFGATSGLIGHYVAGRVTDNAGNATELQGLVIGVRFERGNAILELHNGRSLPASKVEQVTLVENLPPDILAQLQQELGRVPPTDHPADADTDPVGEDDGAADGADGEDAPGHAGAFVASRLRNTPSFAATMNQPGAVKLNAQWTHGGDVLAALLAPSFGLEP